MATFDYTLKGVCPKILRQARDLAGKNYAMNLGPKTGALDFILSPMNTGGIKKSYTQQGSKVIRATVLYKQRAIGCEIQTGADGLDASLCDTASEPVEKSVDLTVGDRISTYPIKFSNYKMVQICQDTESWTREFLETYIKAAREKLSEKIIAKMVAGAGTNYRQDNTTKTSSTWTQVPLLYTNGQVKVPLAANFNDILMDYQNMQFSGTPALIGQGNLQTFFSLNGYACCNTNTPYANAISQSNAAFFLDQSANKVLGADPTNGYTRFIMAAFGASHLLWFNENTNIMIDTEVIKHFTIPDPVYPQLSWDLDFKWDECNKVWTFMYSAYFDVFNVFQSDSFKQDDPSPACDDSIVGVTGIWKYSAGSV